LACRSRVAQPDAAEDDGAATACGDDDDEAGEADEAGADDGADDAAEDEGADADVVAEDTGGGVEEELPAAHPATTDPAAATPASLSNNEIEPVITNHPF
jgi:hypothetical protein